MLAVKSYKFVGDFETTTDPNDVRVWASCLVDIDSLNTAFIGNDIHSFFEYLKNKNSVVYFHNEKFDGEFVLSYLLTHGYKHKDYKRGEQKHAKTFETLITDDGVFYSITVYFEVKNKKYKKVTIYDSLKKLPFKVEVIANAFDLPDEKGSIDYDAPRPVGHVLTEQEKDYIIKDCRIVAQALKIQFAKGLVKMTNASDAMFNFKESLNGRFENYFPVLPVKLDLDIRRAYKGGFTYLNPVYRCRRILEGIVLDVNSLYPSVMYDRLLPYGYPMHFEGMYEPDENYPLFIIHLKCCFELKKDHIPCVQLKNNRRFVETEYLVKSEDEDGIDEPVEMWLTSVDYQLLIDHYDIWDETYINGFKFKGARGMFKDYIDYWMNIKETSTGAMRQLAKLMLNSLYGKFALNPKTRKKIPYLDEDGVVRYELGKVEERDPVYTAMGCFITAYAREKTIRSAQTNYDRFIYADTDSLHLVGFDVPEELDVHPTKLGYWKHEGSFVDSYYIRPKTYLETMREYKVDTLKNYCKILNTLFDVYRDDDKIRYYPLKVTCAGMPDNVKEQVTYDNFHSGSTFDGKLMPRRFRGGIVLIPTTFTIK